MSGTIKREDLLAQLNSVRGGLTSKEIIEQSSCFCFRNKKVLTYNDEVACTNNCQLDITGAVTAAPLLAILEKRDDDVLEYECSNSKLKLRGKKGVTSIRMEAEIALPMENVEYPEKSAWKKLHPDFEDAVGLVQGCAGKDESCFSLTCVHLHPEWIESCDNFQIMRFMIETGLEQSILIKRDALKHIISLGVTKFAETESWMHFKNPGGLILSVRRHVRDDYPDLTSLLEVKGMRTVLPKTLIEATDRAEIFSAENVDNNQVQVKLKPGKLIVKGTGVTGSHYETKLLNYKGEPLTFKISPQVLTEIVKQHNECEISNDRLKVNGGKFIYIACLVVAEKEDKGEGDE